MIESELQAYLQTHYPRENAACEWKAFRKLGHAVSGRKGEDIASYVSAIANMEGGHLVIGVEDQTLRVLGIEDFADYTLDNIRLRLLGRCTNLDSENFRVEAFTTDDSGKTVWVFHIPRHLPRLPVYAHDKAWQRLDDSLVELRSERRDAILAESVTLADWSAETIPAASMADLDPDALTLARQKFKERHSQAAFADQIDGWPLEVFLDRAKLTAQGQVTRTALLLLGKPESVHFLSPCPAQITWKLDTEERSYEHFGPPFLLTTTQVLQRIRNIKQRLFPSHQLLATEVAKYDSRVILEALHNCIAHQDYTLQARILVTERVDRLIFENAGGFFEGTAEDYFTGERTPSRYRNPWLAQAMVQLGMIDTMGYGIHAMTLAQRKRFFPLPDYSKSAPQSGGAGNFRPHAGRKLFAAVAGAAGSGYWHSHTAGPCAEASAHHRCRRCPPAPGWPDRGPEAEFLCGRPHRSNTQRAGQLHPQPGAGERSPEGICAFPVAPVRR